MDRHELTSVIFRHIHKLRLLIKKVAADFSVDDIHRFRVEVKKLRALLRLIGPEDGSLPKGLRRIYKVVGEMRNLQLVRLNLAKAGELPAEFLRHLDSRIVIAKQEARACIEGHGQLKKLPRRMSGSLPVCLTREAQCLFVHKKIVSADRPGLSPGMEEGLHNYRKSIKDLLYTWPFLGAAARKLAVAHFGGRKIMQRDARQLGDYLDIVIQLRLLEDRALFPAEFFSHEVGRLVVEWRAEQERLLPVSLRLMKYSGADFVNNHPGG